MFEFSWYEIMVVFVVALVVIGPKDLPRALHTVGKWVRHARSIASEFQRSVDKVVQDADLKEARDRLGDLKNIANPSSALKDMALKHLDSSGDLAKTATAVTAETATLNQALTGTTAAQPVAASAPRDNADILAELASDADDILLAPTKPPAKADDTKADDTKADNAKADAVTAGQAQTPGNIGAA